MANITQEEALMRIKYFAEQETLYFIISFRQANMHRGYSIPYVAQTGDGKKGIICFTKEAYARAFIEAHHFEILDGIYPIGVSHKDDRGCNLKSILNIARAMAIDFIDCNVGVDDHTLGCDIVYFLEAAQMMDEVSVLLTEKERERLEKGEGGDVTLRFNPMPILNYTNPYELTYEETKRLFDETFEQKDTATYKTYFTEKQNLVENCCVMDYIQTCLIPQAQEQNKRSDMQYFLAVSKILSDVVREKIINEKTIYTLIDPATGAPYVRSECVYVLYTDRFKYMGQFQYEKLEGDSAAWNLFNEVDAKQAVVTDGPHGMAVIEI